MSSPDNKNSHALPGIPTEPVGSIPRPRELQDALVSHSNGDMTTVELDRLFDKAVNDTIARFEATGSPVVSDW